MLTQLNVSFVFMLNYILKLINYQHTLQIISTSRKIPKCCGYRFKVSETYSFTLFWKHTNTKYLLIKMIFMIFSP